MAYAVYRRASADSDWSPCGTFDTEDEAKEVAARAQEQLESNGYDEGEAKVEQE